jgi:hypothetical protein
MLEHRFAAIIAIIISIVIGMRTFKIAAAHIAKSVAIVIVVHMRLDSTLWGVTAGGT